MIDISKLNGIDLYNAVSAVDFDLGIEISKDEVIDIALGQHQLYPVSDAVSNIVLEVLKEAVGG